MSNSIESELAEKPFRKLCQENEPFAIGVLQQLITTEFCLIEPSEANRFSHLAFKFPSNTHEELLESILDCVELLSREPASLSVLADNEDANGYLLTTKSQSLIDKLIEFSTKTTWHLAGIVFVQLNKNKTTDNDICIINSGPFGKNTFNIINKFNYLLI